MELVAITGVLTLSRVVALVAASAALKLVLLPMAPDDAAPGSEMAA